MTPESGDATIVAYLFDAAEGATGQDFDRIITSAACTILDREPGVPVTIDVPFQLTSYLISAGRFLRLVIDTKDKFLSDANAGNTALTLSSTAASPSFIDIPIAAHT